MKEPNKTDTKQARHDEAFRQQAVRMWKQSGKSAELTARELGISVFQLYDWNRKGQPGRGRGPGCPFR
jgi:transposase-like protein